MSKILVKCRPMQFKNGCLLIPATASDRRNLDIFCNEAGDRIVTVTANFSRSNKTYDQCKTVFALTAILFECNYNRIPSSSEKERLYRELLEEYAPREPTLLNPDKDSPIPLSRMNKMQAAEFINSLIFLIMENCDLTDRQQIDVKQIFEEFQANNFGENNPTDYHKDGTMLSEEEWRKKNNFSFASGIKGTEDYPLHLHHILTRGAHKAYEHCSWNWIMLRPEEHDYFHQNGYEKFLELYPSCAGRIKNAFDQGHALYTLELQKGLMKLGLLKEFIDEETEYKGDIF